MTEKGNFDALDRWIFRGSCPAGREQQVKNALAKSGLQVLPTESGIEGRCKTGQMDDVGELFGGSENVTYHSEVFAANQNPQIRRITSGVSVVRR